MAKAQMLAIFYAGGAGGGRGEVGGGEGGGTGGGGGREEREGGKAEGVRRPGRGYSCILTTLGHSTLGSA